MTTDEKGTAMRVPPSRDGDTPSERTPEPARVLHSGYACPDCYGSGTADPRAAYPNPCSRCAGGGLVAHIETITDRAAIRDSDEPSERGDFPYYDLGPATSETVGALGLDAIEGRARYALEWGDSANKEMILALVAEVRSLRAKVAAVEARVVEWEALRDRLRAQNPVRKTGSSGLHRREANTLDVVAEQIRAALATGEGK